ncbi:glycosyl hydrolase family 18 protein [Litoribacillus peritrichatus]|uniref:chitinase n=1 Tax=Litoribacillus peritrichatus TaxID=718191 RepID=A0ABP7MFN6_9GAMM
MSNINSWPSKSLVGYVSAYGSSVPANVSDNMIREAIQNKYTVFVYAFGYVHKDNQVSLPSGVETPVSNLAEQINMIHQAGGLALLSFGGQNNTFLPTDPVEAAKNTVLLCQYHGFDGVDLDLEDIEVGVDFLDLYVSTIRQKDSSLFITAAPQIAGGYGGPASLAPANVFTTSFLKSANFDALFIQEYNQYGGAVFDGLQDTDVGFISASYGPLTKIVPARTKIVVGEPASGSAGSGLSDPSDVVKDIDSGEVMQSPQYGGIMVWSINFDYEQDWSFSRTVHQVVEPVSSFETLEA